MMPKRFGHLIDALTARGHRHRRPGSADFRRGRGTTRSRVARCGSGRTDAAHPALGGARLRRPRRRRSRWCGCNTGSCVELGDSSAPRSAAELRTPIWLITQGAQRVTDDDTVSPEQTCLWGFGRAAALEHPEVWGGLVGSGFRWHRRVVPVARPDRHGTAERRPDRRAESSDLCGPAGAARRAAESQHRWHYVMTQRIW